MDDELEETSLNDLAWDLVHQLLTELDELRVQPVADARPGVLLDFGIDASGSLSAGLALAEVCMAGLCELSIVPDEIDGVHWPSLFVQTDDPVEACLLSQYAGWRIAVEKFFAMGSGPMRAAAAREPLFDKLGYREAGFGVVGILEGSQLPEREVFEFIAQACHVEPDNVALLIAPTASLAGNMQIIARSVETALHKLLEVGFDVQRVESACGTAPIAPVAGNDLIGLGRTNDAILYGGRVTLWVTGDDESLREIGPRVPSCSSPAHGRPFLELFEEAGRDFYKMDPHLFSPAEIVLQNVETGGVHRFGEIRPDLLKRSFGL